MPINVFVSVGKPFSPAQEAFVSSIEEHLKANDLRPRTVGRSDFTHARPLQFIDGLMDRCAGTIVIALERVCIERAFDRRGAPQEKVLENVVIPTPWNHIESAFAYAKALPILVIKDERARDEGLLEKGYDWYVHSTGIETEFLTSREFQGTFESWLRDVRRRAGWFSYRKI
ncbi:MAG: hypothetical protein WC807_11565 [Hyphomicrobium sp.]|jgi:hypothetical protein